MNYTKDVVIVVLVVAVAYLLATRDGTAIVENQSAGSPPSIAVLPFVNVRSDAEIEYLADSISMAIVAALQDMEDVKTTSLASSSRYKGAKQAIERIGADLGVEYMLEGSVRKRDKRVEVHAQLIKIDDGTHVWSDSYERPLDSLVLIPSDIAQSAVRHLNAKLEMD